MANPAKPSLIARLKPRALWTDELFEQAKRNVAEWPIELIADYYVDLPPPEGQR